ncbi:hypothetical protein OEJ84_23090 (plasmid) [Bacillus subtilis]|uniref:Uncharacterized protein n=1 Tax=Bacillus phage vB_BsuS_PJN02 TaxID=2920374 RepID=A0AC61TRW8_9CAUD|nr:hypothetical protein [Bacillus subtilis]YP_010681699.1 hypothetical protein PQE76_gp081 [Bacillus phage vB_BsuS_PJN02]UNH58424.1 hypothetical protein [Bacillus phage vB_BsuS_PJN02]WOF33014.1 hypothetical protein OEJ84_23090 [Bacillus subtilis]
MQNKYIRITKAHNDKSWYKDNIGEVFKLDRENDLFYFIDSPLPSHLCAVNKKCAKLIITEDRVPKVGDKVLITNKRGRCVEYKNGDVLSVKNSFTHASEIEEVNSELILHNEYEVVVYMEEAKKEKKEIENPLLHKVFHKAHLKNMDNKELRDLVTDIFDEISTRAFYEGFKQGQFDEKMESLDDEEESPVIVITDEDIEWAIKEARKDRVQERRNKIVEQAKADVKRLVHNGYDGEGCWGSVGNETYRKFSYSVEFITDSNKRKVTALIRRTSDIHPRHIGRAKALPEDCFNVHIGKAIALRRALGLEVPEEYLNAPQPTEVHVGDVITAHSFTRTVREFITDDRFLTIEGMGHIRLDQVDKIIDDSRENK